MWDKAMEECSWILEFKPMYEKAYYSRAIAKENLGDSDGAINDLKHALYINQSDYSYVLYGDIYADSKKDYKTAAELYIAVSPVSANSMIGAASAYQELGDRKNAITFYKKALQLKPVDSNIAYYIACLYGEDEDYESAKDYLQKAITFDKNNTQAVEYLASIEEADKSNLLNSAIALYDENKYDESFAKFNELLSKDSKNAYALYYRGMIYDAKEKRNEAIRDLQNAFKLNKDFLICNYLIASDYDALGKYKEAYNYYLAYANSNADEDEYKKYAKDRAEELKEYAK